MKILWVSHFVPYPPHGGNLQRSFHLLRCLGAHHEVHLLALSRQRMLPTPAFREEATAALRAFCASVEFFPIEVERSRVRLAATVLANIPSRRPVTVDYFASRRLGEAVRRAARGGIELIHLDTIDLAPYAACAPGVPSVLHHHNVESVLLLRRARQERNPFKRLYYEEQGWRITRYESSEMPRHDLNIAVSELDARGLHCLAPEARIAVVPNGVDLDFFRPDPAPPDPDRVAWAGGMAWGPNRDAIRHFLSEIWPRIHALRPSARFDLIGRKPPPESRSPGVVAHGFVDRIQPIVGRAAAYVVPIRIGGGTRLKVLDAMAMGKAIVSTSIGCEGISVRHEHDILIADTPEEFARETVRVMGDPTLRERLGAAARRTAEALYGWDRIGPALEEAHAIGIGAGSRRPGPKEI